MLGAASAAETAATDVRTSRRFMPCASNLMGAGRLGPKAAGSQAVSGEFGPLPGAAQDARDERPPRVRHPPPIVPDAWHLDDPPGQRNAQLRSGFLPALQIAVGAGKASRTLPQ